ncbi:hypothetical protein CJU89_4603 [Yarrowia sp. B02]|nr:hypothetical protein CJU89_4603 [Yarrowia sp. B02]
MATPPVRGSPYLQAPNVGLADSGSESTSPDPTDYLEASESPKRAFSRDRELRQRLSAPSLKSSKSCRSVKSCRSAKSLSKPPHRSLKQMLRKRHKKPTLTDIFLDPDANDSLYTCHATDMLPKPKHYKVRRWKNPKPEARSYDSEADTYFDSLEASSELRKLVGSRCSTNTTNTRLRYPVGTGGTVVVSGALSEADKSTKSSNPSSSGPTNTWSSSWRPAGQNSRSSRGPDLAQTHVQDYEEETPQLVPERETVLQRLRVLFRS